MYKKSNAPIREQLYSEQGGHQLSTMSFGSSGKEAVVSCIEMSDLCELHNSMITGVCLEEAMVNRTMGILGVVVRGTILKI